MKHYVTLSGQIISAQVYSWIAQVETFFAHVIDGQYAVISSKATDARELGTNISLMRPGRHESGRVEDHFVSCPFHVYAALCVTEAEKHSYRAVKYPDRVELHPKSASQHVSQEAAA